MGARETPAIESTPQRGPARLVWTIRILLVVCVAALAVGGYLSFWRHHLKRLIVVREGVFYRVAQPTELGLKWMAQQHGIRTVVCLRRFKEIRLGTGLIDLNDQDGANEADFVRSLGMNFVQWPMGDEPYWPWCTPWQFEALTRLVDDPANHPIMIHCVGGRHRTGTMSALFRMEYDRWTPDAALAEMYRLDFGPPIAIHEHNLRTYYPRPLPSALVQSKLRSHFVGLVPEVEGSDYPSLIRQLCAARGDSAVEAALTEYVRRGNPFALEMAARLIDDPSDPLAPVAAAQAHARLAVENEESQPDELAIAAALLADFGTPNQQRMLGDWLDKEAQFSQPSRDYEAIVTGLTNRYTRNRVVWLARLLDDTRKRVGEHTSAYRYRDTAVARLSPIANKNFLSGLATVEGWDDAARAAKAWLDEHPEMLEYRQLVPPEGNNPLREGRAVNVEDLSRLPTSAPK